MTGCRRSRPGRKKATPGWGLTETTRGFTPEEEDSGGWEDVAESRQEVVLVGQWVASGWGRGHAPPFVLCLTLAGFPGCSARCLRAGGWWETLSGRAATDRAGSGGWGGPQGGAPGGNSAASPDFHRGSV